MALTKPLLGHQMSVFEYVKPKNFRAAAIRPGPRQLLQVVGHVDMRCVLSAVVMDVAGRRHCAAAEFEFHGIALRLSQKIPAISSEVARGIGGALSQGAVPIATNKLFPSFARKQLPKSGCNHSVLMIYLPALSSRTICSAAGRVRTSKQA